MTFAKYPSSYAASWWRACGLLAVMVLSSWWSTSCSSVTVCTDNQDCGQGLFCDLTSGTCLKECTNDTHCNKDQRCEQATGKCKASVTCLPRAEQRCQNDQMIWFDSCGFQQGQAEDCGAGGCTAKGCNQSSVFPTGCGNGRCEINEDCVTCSEDCGCLKGTLCDTNVAACQAAPDCGNGTCEADKNENCTSCPSDCKCQSPRYCDKKTYQCIAPPASCGDGTCDATQGEHCTSCQSDCACQAGQKCINDSCQGQQQGPCGDGVCDANTESCTTCPNDCGCPSGQTCQNGTCQSTNPATCGDGTCNGNEDMASCCQDCGCPVAEQCQGGQCQPTVTTQCGNSQCEQGETCTSCPNDCGCPSGQTCQNDTCQGPPPKTCGNGTCDNGENCSSCAQDCGCPSGQTCEGGLCKSPPTCTDKCSATASARCSNNQFQTCQKGTNGCYDWKTVQACQASESCITTAPYCKPGCTDSCKATDTARCSNNSLQGCSKGTNGCYSWQNIQTCKASEICITTAPYCKPGCTSTCSSSSPARCSGRNFQTCKQGSNGCYDWVTSFTCGSDESCTTSAPYCKKTCTSSCSSSSPARCSGRSFQTCKQGSNGCYAWVTSFTCGSDEACTTSAPYCKKTCTSTCSSSSPARCSGRNFQTCKQGSNGCYDWVTSFACGSNESCTTSAPYCVPNCTNACTSGAKRCSGKLYQTCVKSTSTGCTYWSTTQTCSSSQSCRTTSSPYCYTPCTSNCSSSSPARCSGKNFQTCKQSSNGCYYWTTSFTCTASQSCRTSAPYCL